MNSLRTGIEQAQFGTDPRTVSAVAALFGLQRPISVLRVINLLEPETLDWDTGSVSSGDDDLVTARGHLWLASTGFWKFTGDVKDSGDGAAFALGMTPAFVDSSGKSLLFGEADQLSDDEGISFNKEGRDLWIAQHWDAIRVAGFKWSLQASASNVTEVIGEVVGALVIGVFAIWLAGGAECKEWRRTKTSEGTQVECTVN
jgi:hypothetical protein